MAQHWMEICLVAGVGIPLLSFVVLALTGHRIGKPRAAWVATAAIVSSCVLSTIVLVGWLGYSPAERTAHGEEAHREFWAQLGTLTVELGVKLDSLTVIMFFMVTFVSSCIHVFSIGYMAGHSDEVDGQSKYHRFFAYLSLFCFSMLGLVVSSSLLFLFIFWELVGMCSYLLIGFYFDKKFASDAAIKAFVTNRVGDFGFIFGLMMVFTFLGTLDLDQAAATFASQYASGTGLFAAQIDLFGWQISGTAMATAMGIGLFCGAMGKSAQFPLHVWLPDAMAGPTPVSALIHAATMVAAGVYLVARIFRLLTPDAQMFIAIIGCITLTITALIAIVQTDIKKVLAYSTLSQLGYMIFGLGCGAWIAALFHLMTHAFFKAMLFLGSGQVIEGCHHEQDIRKMGGLRRKMPVTCWTFFIGVLAIAGVGIPGMGIGLGGYFSKDEILAVAYERSTDWGTAAEHHGDTGQLHDVHLASDREIDHGAASHAGGVDQDERRHVALGMPSLPRWTFWLAIAVAYITPFYMMRCWWLTFCGKPRDAHVYEHAHESKLMYIPLVVLAAGTVFCSYWMFRPLLADAAPMATHASMVVALDGHATEASRAAGLMIGHHAHDVLKWLVGFAFVVGFGGAWFIYRRGLGMAERIVRLPAVSLIHWALCEKLFFDRIYDTVLVGGTKTLLAHTCRLWDTYVIDMLANLSAKVTERVAAFTGNVLDAHGVDGLINGAADTAMDLGALMGRPQTGRIRNYVLFAAGGAVVIVSAIVFGEELVGVKDAVLGLVGTP